MTSLYVTILNWLYPTFQEQYLALDSTKGQHLIQHFETSEEQHQPLQTNDLEQQQHQQDQEATIPINSDPTSIDGGHPNSSLGTDDLSLLSFNTSDIYPDIFDLVVLVDSNT